jgi:CRISPR-associated protein Cas1
MMAPVYVQDQGAVVRRQGERLIVTREKERLLDLPLLHVDQLVLFGNVQITSQAVAMLLQAEVDVVYLSQYGKFRGRLVNTGSKFAKLRHAQLQKMSSEVTTLAIARQVVVGKLHNQQLLLQKKLAETQHVLPVQQAASSIGRQLEQARLTRSIDSLRGYEGKAGADYWGAFKVLLVNNLGFQGRKYFPPPDPVNSLLSFGYSLLLKDVSAAVQLVGLDPFLGFFHTIDYGRPSLSLDMMEEFRPGLVDWLVLNLVNQGQVTAADFERTGQADRPVRLKERALTELIKQYEQRLNEKVLHADGGGQTSYRRVLELQVRRLARLMLDQEQGYQPFLWS